MKKGSKHTPESRAKMSAAKRGKAPFAGKRHSPESKAKMSAYRTGRKRPRKKPLTPEHRARIAAALAGRTLSDETRAKMSAAQRRRRAREVDEWRSTLVPAPEWRGGDDSDLAIPAELIAMAELAGLQKSIR